MSNENYVAVTGKVTQYGRLRIGAEYFGSILSKRHIRSSYILAHFINQRDNDIDTYPGQVQFYFEHTVHLPNASVNHYLAFIKWYKPVTTADTRFFFLMKILMILPMIQNFGKMNSSILLLIV